MARKNFKKKPVDTSGEVLKAQPEEMKLSGHRNTFALAAFVLVVAVCVVPLAALSNSHLPHPKRTVLAMDKASLTVKNELDSDIMVFWVSDHCYQCLYKQLGLVPAAPSPGQPALKDLLVDTQHGMTLQLNHTLDNLVLCTLPFHFGEHGNYSLWVKNFPNSSVVSCSIVTLVDPIQSYIPILIAFLIYTGLALVSAIGNTLLRLDVVKNFFFRLRGTMDTERLINSELGPPGRNTVPVTDNILLPPPASTNRLQSLDTFRGISLVIMVFVNYGGGRYWFFRHESWNGLTVADLVFPWFMFIMGTSIALSIHSLLRKGSTRLSLLGKVAWRSLQLFIIGLLIINPNYCQGPLSWNNLRIPGVLQRLAVAYLVVACLDLLVARSHLDVYATDAWWSRGIDILLYWPAWVCVFFLESIWLFVTFLLPVSDCPTGYLGPGGIGDMGLYPNCTGGAAGFIDRWLLGEKHIYQNPSSRGVYATHLPYDPEGILGSINSILMAFLGLQAGKILLHHRDVHQGVISRFLIWGFLLGIISAVLTSCSTNQGLIPINKNLWSLSYVTTLACFAYVLLALIYYTVDVKKWWSGGPFFYPGVGIFVLVFVIAGMNSILVYVGHEVFKDYFPFRWQMRNSQSHTEHLTQNLVATSCWVFISYVLYRKKIFFKI